MKKLAAILALLLALTFLAACGSYTAVEADAAPPEPTTTTQAEITTEATTTQATTADTTTIAPADLSDELVQLLLPHLVVAGMPMPVEVLNVQTRQVQESSFFTANIRFIPQNPTVQVSAILPPWSVQLNRATGQMQQTRTHLTHSDPEFNIPAINAALQAHFNAS